MNSSNHFVLLLVAILVCFIVNKYYNKKQESYTDFTYAPVGTYGLNSRIKPISLTQYANQIANDLQNPFPPSSTGNSRGVARDVPWQPESYRDYQEPDGQIVGILSYN